MILLLKGGHIEANAYVDKNILNIYMTLSIYGPTIVNTVINIYIYIYIVRIYNIYFFDKNIVF